MKTIHITPTHKSERGQSLVELAVVIVIMLILLAGVIDLGRVVFEYMTMADAAHIAMLDRLTRQLDPNDPVNIQFTSGTTGAPKGATLTHRNIVNNADQVTSCMNFTAEDRLCIPVPFYHCFGMVLGNMACVTHGACMVIPGEGFDPETTLETVAAECAGIRHVTAPEPTAVRTFLKNSFAFGGIHASLVCRRWTAGEQA